jgi:hypothetical protein
VNQSKFGLVMVAFIIGVTVPTLVLLLTTGGHSKGDGGAGANTALTPVGTPAPLEAVRPDRILATSTPTPIAVAATPLATTAPPAPVAQATTAPPAPPAQATAPPPVLPTPSPVPAAPVAQASLNGRFRLTDTVTEGSGAGQSVSFDIELRQVGDVVSGGNSEISLSGQVQGDRAVMQFVQPALGYRGSFDWTISSGGGTGSFSTSVPNRGVSMITPLP